MQGERLEILRMLEAGQIDPEEAASLLAAVDAAQDASLTEDTSSTEDTASAMDAASGQAPILPRGPSERPEQAWARFWVYPLMAGGIILVLGLLVMGLIYTTDAARGWLICGWLPVFLGTLVILLAWWSRQATWLHLRIGEGGQRKLALSFPLPLTFAAWGIRIAQPFVPKLKEIGADELIVAVRDSPTRDSPIFIDVQDDEDDERGGRDESKGGQNGDNGREDAGPQHGGGGHNHGGGGGQAVGCP
jgi:uncharacterized membrane protein YgcG